MPILAAKTGRERNNRKKQTQEKLREDFQDEGGEEMRKSAGPMRLAATLVGY